MTFEIADCCKELKLSRNIAEMSETIQADSHQEYLLKLLRSEIEHREATRKDKLLKNAGFYSIKSFESFRFELAKNIFNSLASSTLNPISDFDSSFNRIEYF